MTSTASKPARSDRQMPRQASPGEKARAAQLRAAGIRTEFDNITSAMTSILTAVGAAMREVRQDNTRATLAEQATGWVKPLVALAGGIINGGTEADVDYIMTH